MARDSKWLRDLVERFAEFPEPERYMHIGRAVVAAVAEPAKRGARPRAYLRDWMMAFDNELLKRHRPEWDEDQRFAWLAERHGIKHKQPHVTVRKRLASTAANASVASFDWGNLPK